MAAEDFTSTAPSSPGPAPSASPNATSKGNATLPSASTTSRPAQVPPPPLFMRKPEGPFMPSVCHHGRRRSQCVDCYDEGTGGSTICKHRRQRYSCRNCFDEGLPTNSLW
ncbi:hypothetical protein BC830DRAFT_562481 [Chytriomyces sp. MP71]|nr:hypothetical protein BC830DRAFT_562481 [Chytriomyces sp. MP71]